jgi:hypothetical protein
MKAACFLSPSMGMFPLLIKANKTKVVGDKLEHSQDAKRKDFDKNVKR